MTAGSFDRPVEMHSRLSYHLPEAKRYRKQPRDASNIFGNNIKKVLTVAAQPNCSVSQVASLIYYIVLSSLPLRETARGTVEAMCGVFSICVWRGTSSITVLVETRTRVSYIKCEMRERFRLLLWKWSDDMGGGGGGGGGCKGFPGSGEGHGCGVFNTDTYGAALLFPRQPWPTPAVTLFCHIKAVPARLFRRQLLMRCRRDVFKRGNPTSKQNTVPSADMEQLCSR